MFKLSQRSLDKLDGVHPDLVAVVKRAIELTDVDFGVTYGVRTLEEQEKLYNSGRSQTMKSKHLIQDTGYSHAVDLVAYDGSDVVWEINVYDNICDDTAEDAMNAYIDLRRSQGRRPFIDGPHFELM
jgi:peptidoglycan L-alanyl-D-glutamate endopeptidase CwlK